MEILLGHMLTAQNRRSGSRDCHQARGSPEVREEGDVGLAAIEGSLELTDQQVSSSHGVRTPQRESHPVRTGRVRRSLREPDAIRRRTLARLALSFLVTGALTGTLVEPAVAGVPKLVFPIVGNATYEDDFGDPRGQGSHEGNDMMAPWKSSVDAVEAGRIKIWTSSSRAGCMLYLYGKSGTTYLYIHLNNDLTKNNDNDGGCKQGVSFAPGLEDGAQVRAGELIGYVGDSGDADGIDHHLHFELHPGDGGAVSPYRHLRSAEKLLFALPEGGRERRPLSRSRSSARSWSTLRRRRGTGPATRIPGTPRNPIPAAPRSLTRRSYHRRPRPA